MTNDRPTLLYHDMFIAGHGFGGPGIYWLRLWQRESGHIAVVTQVPGNPGPSITNGHSSIVACIAERFEVSADRLTFFEIWPSGAIDEGMPAQYMLVTHGSTGPEWLDAELAEIEREVGEALPPLPPHEELVNLVREAGGMLPEPIFEQQWEALPVAELPFPHNPSSCAHIGRFQELDRQLVREVADRDERRVEIGRRFIESLTATDRQRCRFHQADWRGIADASVRILSECGGDAPRETIRRAVSSARLGAPDQRWLSSLFVDPVVVTGGSSYTNGQHRGCALRFSGADRAAVVVGYRETDETEAVWEYRGDG